MGANEGITMRVLAKILTKESKEATASDDVDSEKLFRLIAEVSNTETDSHSHVVSEKFLKTMRGQLNSGKVPFIGDHNMEKMIGRSVSGKMEDGTRLIGDFDILRNWNYGVDTNEFIKGVEASMLTDVSGGFKIKAASCTICKKQAFISRKAESFEDKCWDHLPGRKYKSQIAKWLLEEGDLIEVSSVPSGANQNTEILDYTKQMMGDVEFFEKFEVGDDLSGILPFLDDTCELIKSYQEHPNSSIFLPKKIPTGGKTMSAELEQILATHIGKASTVFKELPTDQGDAVGKIVEGYQTLHDAHETLKSEVDDYKTKAESYDTYVDSRIEKALKFGIQADGEEFDKDSWERILKGYGDLQLVEIQSKKWEDAADKELGEEGATSKQSDEEAARRKSKPGDDSDEETAEEYEEYY